MTLFETTAEGVRTQNSGFSTQSELESAETKDRPTLFFPLKTDSRDLHPYAKGRPHFPCIYFKGEPLCRQNQVCYVFIN